MTDPHLSVVVPAFNEAARLPGRLEEIYRFLSDNPAWLPAEILVVDDGSDDGTLTAAAGRPCPAGADIRLLRHPRNRGKGAAVRTGFAASRGELVLMSDADHSTPVEELAVLVRALAPGTVVIGSRAVDRTRILRRQPWYRDLMGRTFNLAVQALALPGLHDTQCGFKLFPGHLARALASRQRISGFAYDVELLLTARRWGWRVVEVPVHWAHAEASRVSPLRHSAEMLLDLVRLRLRPTPPPPPEGRPRGLPGWLPLLYTGEAGS